MCNREYQGIKARCQGIITTTLKLSKIDVLFLDEAEHALITHVGTATVPPLLPPSVNSGFESTAVCFYWRISPRRHTLKRGPHTVVDVISIFLPSRNGPRSPVARSEPFSAGLRTPISRRREPGESIEGTSAPQATEALTFHVRGGRRQLALHLLKVIA